MVTLQTDIAVDIEIPIFRYSLFVKFHAEILVYFQTDTKYLDYWPAPVDILDIIPIGMHGFHVSKYLR